MAKEPVLQSKEQITGDLIDGIRARLRKDIDLNDGSVLTQLIEAISQNLFKSQADIISMIDALSVDRAEGEALQRLAKDRNVPILPALPSTGRVSITDTSFTKISMRIYAGQPAPVAGSLVIYVASAADIPTAGGKIYLGRGTTNVEGPLTYISTQIEAGGAYWSITLAPTSPTTKFHNIGEVVVLAQGGNRLIPAGTTLQTAQGSSVTATSFNTTSAATIIDGETTVGDVPVKCAVPGTIGNVSRGSLNEIVGMPFSATTFNDLAFFNGRNADTEDDIKERIKAYEQAKSKGTEQAIETASKDVVAKDELKKVQSSSIVRYTDNTTDLVFDDGSGYEPNFVGAPFEVVVDSAQGGETEVQLRQKPVAQARIKNSLIGPYPIENNSFLTVEVDGTETTHQFVDADFKVPSSATAFEIMASINGDSNINFLCSTANNGLNLVVYPKTRTSNGIIVKSPSTGVDANIALGFPLNETVTIRLYKNDIPLHQDGIYASVSSRSKSSWSPAISAGDTLKYKVDGTPEVTATFNLADFQAVNITATVSYLTSIDIWAAVCNNLMPGVQATVVGDIITFTSTRGNSNNASIEITGGTLLSQLFSSTDSLISAGQAPDFTFNKQTGQIAFTDALLPGDNITVGSQFTRGNQTSLSLPDGVSTAGKLWMISDGAAIGIPNDLKANTSITFQKSGTLLTISAASPSLVPEGFDQAQAGDWIIVWSNSSDLPPLISNSGFWRIQSVQVGQIIVDDGTTSRSNLNLSFTPMTDRIVIVRSDAAMQMLDFSVNQLVPLVAEMNSKLTGIFAEIIGSKIRLSTTTFANDGELFIAAADQGGQVLGLTLSSSVSNSPAHFGFTSQADSEAGVPSFTHAAMGSAVTDTVFNLANYDQFKGEEDDFVEILEKYDTLTASPIIESNKARRAFVADYDYALSRISLLPPAYMKVGQSLIQENDRFFLRSSYKFDSNDIATAVLDGDSATKSFVMPVARKLTVSSNSTPTTQDFSTTDAESNLALSNTSSFYNFDFANFKIHRQASTILTNGTFSLKVKCFDFGPSGDRVRVGLAYPENVESTSLSHKFDVSDVIDVKLFLPVSTVRSPNWDYTTAFTVAKTTSGGKDTLTFTYRSGLQPNFSNVGADVHVGDIVFISSDADFLSANTNIKARVSLVTPTSFSIELPTGAYTSDNVSFSTMVNQNGVTTVSVSGGHNLTTGQRIGMWNTASADGLTYPFNTTYTVNVVNANQFTVSTPVAVPTSNIQSATFISNLVTVTTVTPHGLSAQNVIIISNAGSPYDGTAPVSAVITPYQFQFVKTGSAPAIASGRVDFQSYLPDLNVGITSVSKTGNVVTVNTSASHFLPLGAVVKVAGVTVIPWSNVTAYAANDVVSYSGNNYIALLATTGDQPDVSPTKWAVTSFSLNGSFIVDSTPLLNQFTYLYLSSGTTTGTGGTSTRYISGGSMARSLGGATNENLQFAPVSTTAQAVADYATANLANKMLVTVDNANPSATILMSTEDQGLGANYISTTVTSLHVFVTSRRAKLRTPVTLPAGSRITISGMAGAAASWNTEYVVLSTYLDQGLGFIVSEIQLPSLATSSATLTPGGTVTGSTPMLMLKDGENTVWSSNLLAGFGSPMFTARNQWSVAPAIGEELRVVAVNNEQLVRFWNKLIVTGFTNVGKIELSRYGRELQLSTKTFGGSGSVQLAGGTANKIELAAVGSAAELTTKLGQISVPYDVRKGLLRKQWLNISNTVRQNKTLQFSNTTTIQLYADGAEITAGTGTFQTVRNINHFADTQFKVEKHGEFTAIIRTAGQSPNLQSIGVQEGDWVRLHNVTESTWVSSTVYASGARVNYNGFNYTSLQNANTGNQPDISSTFWQVQEFGKANQGIFQVVRVFGEDSFWIKHDNAAEEMFYIGNVNNMRFYAYDSVMPGDTLVISTHILGSVNVGRYTVLDEVSGPGYYFPTATRIYTSAIPATQPATVLGGEFNQINIEEQTPTSLWKRIFAFGPGEGSVSSILVDSPNLMNKISSSLGAQIVGKSKLAMNEDINFGIDGYKYYIGLIRELNKIIYGDPADRLNYPGIRAAGTAIGIKEAILRRITASFILRIKSGVPFTEIRERVKASVAGYVNNLGVGESVSISRMIAAANTVPGVVAVSITYPVYSSTSDLIVVSAHEKAFVVDPTVDITVSVLG